MLTLPGGRGFAEILIDSGAAAGGKSRTQSKTRIVAYFYQPDGTSEMSPGPSDVKVKVGTGEKSPVLDLSPLPKESGKYASEPGTFPDGFRGRARRQGQRRVRPDPHLRSAECYDRRPTRQPRFSPADRLTVLIDLIGWAVPQ